MAPARQHMFDEEPPPPAVVFDSDFVINVLHENEDFHLECRLFAERLRAAGSRTVYSPLLRIDFWHGWRRAVRLRGIPDGLMAAESPGDEMATRERIFKLGDDYLREFLGLFERFEVRIGTELLDSALTFAARYNLRSHDACLVAVALQTEVRDIATLDKDFLRVDGIELWNNDIPGRRAAQRVGQ